MPKLFNVYNIFIDMMGIRRVICLINISSSFSCRLRWQRTTNRRRRFCMSSSSWTWIPFTTSKRSWSSACWCRYKCNTTGEKPTNLKQIWNFPHKIFNKIKFHTTISLLQHFYPDGGWGWIISGVAFLAHVLTTGFQLSYGLLLLYAMRHLGQEVATETGMENLLPFCLVVIKTISVCCIAKK